MSAKIIDLAARRRATAPEPDVGGARTDREEARHFLLLAVDKLDIDNPEEAGHWARAALHYLDRMVPGTTPEEEHAELMRRARRIERASKGSETRRRNMERRDAALNAAGIVLTRDGVILPG
jgi:hypothetical protein